MNVPSARSRNPRFTAPSAAVAPSRDKGIIPQPESVSIKNGENPARNSKKMAPLGAVIGKSPQDHAQNAGFDSRESRDGLSVLIDVTSLTVRTCQ